MLTNWVISPRSCWNHTLPKNHGVVSSRGFPTLEDYSQAFPHLEAFENFEPSSVCLIQEGNKAFVRDQCIIILGYIEYGIGTGSYHKLSSENEKNIYILEDLNLTNFMSTFVDTPNHDI